MEDTYFAFTARNRIRSTCRLLVNGHCVLASDINQGVSVTNAAEAIATAVVQHYRLDPARLVFIEHYPTDETQEERFARVAFAWSRGVAHEAKWSHLSKAAAEQLLGERIEIEGVVEARARTVRTRRR